MFFFSDHLVSQSNDKKSEDLEKKILNYKKRGSSLLVI